MKEVQQAAMTQGFSKELRAQEHHILKGLNLKEQQEEILSKQKSRNCWLKEGERNEKFFHKASIQHRQGNQMVRLKRIDGTYGETQIELEQTLNGFYADLMEEPDINLQEMQEHVLNHIPKVITTDHNIMLMKPIDMDELEATVMQMEADKAPGPDWFTTNFFHSC